MPQFILFVREDLTRYPLPTETLQLLIVAHTAWAKELGERGIFVDGNGIPSKGILVEQKDITKHFIINEDDNTYVVEKKKIKGFLL